MPYIQFPDEDGHPVIVDAANPLPVTGAGGGGGMEPADVTAAAPATAVDNGDGTLTIGVSTGTGATQAAKGNHSHTPASVGAATSAQGALADSAVQPGDLATVATSGAYSDLSGTPSIPTVPVAAHVADADGTDTATLAASVNALRDALVAAGLMAGA